MDAVNSNIEFRFGPADGRKKLLIFESESIILEIEGRDYLYRKTPRCNADGEVIYQYIMELLNGRSLLCGS